MYVLFNNYVHIRIFYNLHTLHIQVSGPGGKKEQVSISDELLLFTPIGRWWVKVISLGGSLLLFEKKRFETITDSVSCYDTYAYAYKSEARTLFLSYIIKTRLERGVDYSITFWITI